MTACKHSMFVSMATLFSFACSEHALSEKGSGFALDEDSVPENGSEQQLRMDILPNSSNGQLMPQSIFLDPGTDVLTDLTVSLNPTIWISGTVQGFEIYPHSDTTAPGATVKVASQIILSKNQSISGGVYSSDEMGYFNIPVPAEAGYQLTVSPLSPSELPFYVSETLDLIENATMNIDLGFGVPVYGSVSGLGDWASLVDAQLVDFHTGTKGVSRALDGEGRFMLRAPVDRADLQLKLQSSNEDWACPTVYLPFRIEDEASEDAHEINFEFNDLNMVEVSGRILRSDGSRFDERADIRFTALELSDTPGELIIESSNDGEGDFSVTLLPGKWKAEFIPPFGDDFSAAPVEVLFDIEDDASMHEMGEISLRTKVRIVGQVANHDGNPEAAVIVSLKEQSFKNYVYSTTTDPDGRFELMAPSVRYDTTLTPSLGNSAVTHFSIPAPESGQEIQWILQQGQMVQGVVNADDVPVPYAMIQIWNGDKKLADSITADDGSFSLRIQTEE